MADNFDFSGMISPEATAREDAMRQALRSNPALFSSLEGGGVGLPSAGNPAVAPASPSPAIAPAAVTPSGKPTVRDIGTEAMGRAAELMRNAPDPQKELADEKALSERLSQAEQNRARNLRDTQGNLTPEYRPTVAQKIFRGLRGAAEGLAFGGIPGAIRGAVVPNMYPGARGYGAPNKAGEQELRRQDSEISTTKDSLAELRNRFKEAHDAATGNAAEWRGIGTMAKDLKESPEKIPATPDAFVIQQAMKQFPDDPAAQLKYVQENTGKADKKPTNYEQTVIAAQNEADPSGPLHRAAKEMRDTEVRKFKAGNQGRQPTETELWSQAFQSEYGRKPNAEEISSRHVSGGGTAGGAAGKPQGPAHTKDRTSFESHWSKQLGPGTPVEKKYDAQRKTVAANEDLSDTEKQAKFTAIEAEREAEKAKLQTEKDAEAEQYGVYNQPSQPAAPVQSPAAVNPSGNQPAPQAQNSGGKKLDSQNPQDVALAHRYLEKAGGDKNKARQLAKSDGYNF